MKILTVLARHGILYFEGLEFFFFDNEGLDSIWAKSRYNLELKLCQQILSNPWPFNYLIKCGAVIGRFSLDKLGCPPNKKYKINKTHSDDLLYRAKSMSLRLFIKIC